ncbi:ATP-binding cassette domain-containing protein [Streptomyces sp. UG1]|uniref:ATP-binding cassette domain-containing protein n=1 Tax=Streptomyces sp. UG1 TaxID=3417652 RepID=UPI003CF83409
MSCRLRQGVDDPVVMEAHIHRQQARNMWLLGPVHRRESFYSELLTGHRAAKGTAKEIRLFRAGAFVDVWFRYHDDQDWILRGVTLHIPVGLTTAIVGINGARKSTLIKLLCRFFDPCKGRILWDGVDIRDYEPEAYRARLSAMFQGFMECDLTAAENIASGRLEVLGDTALIERAARRAGIHEEITRLSGRYETLLSLVLRRRLIW